MNAGLFAASRAPAHQAAARPAASPPSDAFPARPIKKFWKKEDGGPGEGGKEPFSKGFFLLPPAVGDKSSFFLLPPAAGGLFSLLALTLLFCLPEAARAAENLSMPGLQLSLSGTETEPKSVALALEILFLLTVLSLAPAIMLTVTSFTRIIVVFHFVRQALGVQQLPPNQIMISLAIFMTVAIMMPVGKQINDTALQPYLEERLSFDEALVLAEAPLREFMFKHTREKDLSIFYSITKMDRPQTKEDVPTISLAAAFVISELKTGFTIGFLLYIPFLILDMVVSSTLLAMGMMMLPPMMVSMPFKLLLFVMVDGWTLLVGSLVNSFLL